jgi:histidine triad (HIT) family protein
LEDCIFCKIVRGELPSFKVYEDDRIFAFEDINPVSKGHTLVIPKKHAQDLWEISIEDLSALHIASQKIIRAIKIALDPLGVACVQLNGRGVNQVVMHYHLHLVPRSNGEPELPMNSWALRQGDMQLIEKTAGKIAASIKK